MQQSGVGSPRGAARSWTWTIVTLAALVAPAAAEQPAPPPAGDPPADPPAPPPADPPAEPPAPPPADAPADAPAPPPTPPPADAPADAPAPPAGDEAVPTDDEPEPAPEIPQAKVRHAARSRIDDAPPPPVEAGPPANYVGLFAGTSLAYRPPGGPIDVAPGDLSLSLGYGRAISARVSLELDLGVTLIEGDYASVSLVPAVIYLFNADVYGALRVIVPIDPEVDVALAPGLGISHGFGENLAILELGAVSFVGHGDPDFAISLTAGLLRFF